MVKNLVTLPTWLTSWRDRLDAPRHPLPAGRLAGVTPAAN